MEALEILKNTIGIVSAGVAVFSIGRVFYAAFTAPVNVHKRHSTAEGSTYIVRAESTGFSSTFTRMPMMGMAKKPEQQK